MNFEADKILLEYFQKNILQIENWFNVISPVDAKINILKEQLINLKNKPWKRIL